MFSDDIVLLVLVGENPEEVNEKLEQWRATLEKKGFKINKSKTETICDFERNDQKID